MTGGGHVAKKKDARGRARWYPVLEAPRDPESGRRRQKWLGGHETRKAATAALREALVTVDRGLYVEPTKETTGQYLEEWLEAIRSTVRPTTHASYRHLIVGQVVPRLGSVPLRQLGPGHLNRVYAQLLTEGRRTKAGGGLSPRTVRYTHVVVHRALKDAVRWGKLVRNPAELADPPREVRVDRRVWGAEEVRAFLVEVEAAGDRLAALYHLAATTGMRRGELLGLAWSAVDLDVGSLHVVRTLVDVAYSPTFSEPKTARSRRSIALDPATVGRLRRHRTAQAEERLAWGSGYRSDGLVFSREDGSPINPQSVSLALPSTCERPTFPGCASMTSAMHTPQPR